jgi:DNA repair exonuclease SbcCD ATPase subunit
MSRDELSDSTIPSFAASREEAVAGAPRGAVPSRGSRPSSTPAGMGFLGRLVLTVTLVTAAVACAWAWQLQMALETSQTYARSLATRVADLEALLSDTDESVEKSAAALGAQLKVVDSETRRLEQRRREMDARLEKVEKNTGSALTRVGKLEPLVAAQGKTVATLKSVADDLDRLAKTAKDAQANTERLADNVNKSNLERAALSKRVASNEEWIEAINAFRKQVNANISRLESEIRAVQPTPPGMQ